MKPSLIVCISGSIGSGKSTLSQALSKRLGWKSASFGEYIRKIAKVRGLDYEDRTILQDIGESLINEGWETFCNNVLSEVDWKKGESIIVDGIRHIGCIETLKKVISLSEVILLFINLDKEIQLERLKTRKNRESLSIRQIESHSTEVQVNERLKGLADLVLQGDKPVDNLVSEVTNWITNRLDAEMPDK